MNLISYQTASFGANGQAKPVVTEMIKQDKAEDKTILKDAVTKEAPPNENQNQNMFASMSDLNFVAAAAGHQASSTKFQSLQSVNPEKTQPIKEEQVESMTIKD